MNKRTKERREEVKRARERKTKEKEKEREHGIKDRGMSNLFDSVKPDVLQGLAGNVGKDVLVVQHLRTP